MAKILNIVETAYRATIEEQDDTILWLAHALKNAGADITLLLRANAVNYAVRGHDASGLKFGDIAVAHAPVLDQDLHKFIEKGVPVYLVEEDLQEHGLSNADLIAGVQRVSRRDLPGLIDKADHVWHW
jgi:sulfur relay (sulfurtransferase) DsrF/TusC family protein